MGDSGGRLPPLTVQGRALLGANDRSASTRQAAAPRAARRPAAQARPGPGSGNLEAGAPGLCWVSTGVWDGPASSHRTTF